MRRHKHALQLQRALLAVAVLLLAGGAAVPSRAADDDGSEPPASVEVLAGGGVSLSDESAAIPGARVVADSPLYVGSSGAAIGRLRVALGVSGVPGERVELREPTTWKSAEVTAEYQRRIGAQGTSSTYLVGRTGFLTRFLPRDEVPRERFARVYGVGVRAERRDKDGAISRSISAIVGRSELASPTFHRGQAVVEGQVRLFDVGPAAIVIVADAHLNIGKAAGRGARDVMRAQVMARVDL
jgi:hypothetical protein